MKSQTSQITNESNLEAMFDKGTTNEKNCFSGSPASEPKIPNDLRIVFDFHDVIEANTSFYLGVFLFSGLMKMFKGYYIGWLAQWTRQEKKSTRLECISPKSLTFCLHLWLEILLPGLTVSLFSVSPSLSAQPNVFFFC